MSDEWEETTLGAVCSFASGKNAPKSIRVDHGPFRMLGANGHIGYVNDFLHTGPLITVGRVGAYGAVHYIGTDERCWVSDNALVATPKDVVDRKFLRYLLESVDYEAIRTGTTQPLITQSSLSGVSVLLPPLSVQRRIVDLMEHLDTHIANLESENAAAEQVLQRMVIERFSLPSSGETGTPLHDLFIRNIGGVWGTALGGDERDCAVFRTTEFSNLGVLTGAADARRSITEKQYASRALEVGDILMEKSGGTPGRPVGRVVRVDESDLKGAAVGANFLQLLRADAAKVDPNYLFWVLWGTHRRGDPESYQQASTNIRNLKTKDYLARRASLPLRDVQCALSEAADSVLRLILRLAQEVASLRDLRRGLLRALLVGEQEIIGSYDDLVGVTS